MTSSTRPSGGTRDRLVDALRTIERLKRELAAADAAAPPAVEPIAVVGMSCRLPGGADDPGEFWRLLGEGFDAAREFPADRADARSLYDPDPDAPGRAYTITGSFLDRVDLFEPEVFGIAPREAVGMDPQQRITLEVAWEALERAGHAPDRLDGTSTGVYLGVSTTDYVRLRQELGDWAEVDAYTRVGAPSFIAGRIAYTLGLQGPAKVMDTTCSSSLVAVHEACQALRLGECDLALAGGANVMLAPYGFLLMSKFRALSPDGRCKTFDAAADGYGRGEGVGVVVLRRLSDALRDHDHIHALVRGSAVNHDGRSSGLTVPNPAAQQAVVRAALSQAGVDPAEVSYVEAHGTGTSLGDPIELRALEAVVGRHRPGGEPLRVGSVKTNIGHLESAAGIAGLIKLVLAVENGEIPPHLHLRDPNPNVDWDALHITVPTERSPWTGPRVGGLSSFGASGTNAHAVVSEAPGATVRSGPDGAAGPGVLVASARTPEALRELADRWARHLAAGVGGRRVLDQPGGPGPPAARPGRGRRDPRRAGRGPRRARGRLGLAAAGGRHSGAAPAAPDRLAVHRPGLPVGRDGRGAGGRAGVPGGLRPGGPARRRPAGPAAARGGLAGGGHRDPTGRHRLDPAGAVRGRVRPGAAVDVLGRPAGRPGRAQRRGDRRGLRRRRAVARGCGHAGLRPRAADVGAAGRWRHALGGLLRGRRAGRDRCRTGGGDRRCERTGRGGAVRAGAGGGCGVCPAGGRRRPDPAAGGLARLPLGADGADAGRVPHRAGRAAVLRAADPAGLERDRCAVDGRRGRPGLLGPARRRDRPVRRRGAGAARGRRPGVPGDRPAPRAGGARRAHPGRPGVRLAAVAAARPRRPADRAAGRRRAAPARRHRGLGRRPRWRHPAPGPAADHAMARPVVLVPAGRRSRLRRRGRHRRARPRPAAADRRPHLRAVRRAGAGRLPHCRSGRGRGRVRRPLGRGDRRAAGAAERHRATGAGHRRGPGPGDRPRDRRGRGGAGRAVAHARHPHPPPPGATGSRGRRDRPDRPDRRDRPDRPDRRDRPDRPDRRVHG